MAAEKDIQDDEYVAKLLADDAKKSSIRYSSLGLSALLPQRATNSAPKPNTRFLKSIIRETDTHNAALKKKEELEARIRLRKMREESQGHPYSRHGEEERPTKRRRLSDDNVGRRKRTDRRKEGRLREPSLERSRSRERRDHRGSRRQTAHSKSSDSEDGYRRAKRERRRRSRSRRRDGTRARDQSVEDRRHGHKSRRRSRSLSRPESSEAEIHRTGRKDQDRTLERRAGDRKPEKQANSPQSHRRKPVPKEEGGPVSRPRGRSSSSDPLEDLVGPLPAPKASVGEPPPLRSRGRGAYRSSGAAMDAHFLNDYDPRLDLHPESEAEDEKEDWDMALEALRDREMWKQKHADRLREAGFADEDIKKWEDSGKEKDIGDVKWSGKGEAREWDLGKVVQDEPEEKPRKKDLEDGWKRKGGGFLKSFKEALS